MKRMKYLWMGIICLGIISCNDDDSPNSPEDDPQPTGFFNPDVLKVGNKWVYWHYEIDNYFENPEDIQYTGRIDSIEVVGKGEYSGITYSIFHHRYFSANGSLISEHYSKQRITPSSHLVGFDENQNPEDEEHGGVLHPGMDDLYVRTHEYEPFGSVEYRLRESASVNIDGNIYEVSPFNGIFTPNEDFPDLISKTIEFNYNKDVGLVNTVCHSMFGVYAFGERLVSFTSGQ